MWDNNSLDNNSRDNNGWDKNGGDDGIAWHERRPAAEVPVFAVNMVLAVGNVLMGDDGAGPLLAERLQASPIPDWAVIDGGAIPENAVHTLRANPPQRLLVVDATDMGLPAGEIRIIDPRRIAEDMLMNTHSLPLNFMIDTLAEFIPEVIFIGIQPALVAFYCPMSKGVIQAVERIYQRLPGWQHDGGFARAHCPAEETIAPLA